MIGTVNRQQPTAVMFMRGASDMIEGVIEPQAMGALKSVDDLPLLWRPAHWAVLEQVGHIKAREFADDGAWLKAQLDTSSRYFETLKTLIASGKIMFGNHSIIGQLVTGKGGSVSPLKEYGIVLQPRQPTATQQRRWLELRTRLARLQSMQNA